MAICLLLLPRNKTIDIEDLEEVSFVSLPSPLVILGRRVLHTPSCIEQVQRVFRTRRLLKLKRSVRESLWGVRWLITHYRKCSSKEDHACTSLRRLEHHRVVGHLCLCIGIN